MESLLARALESKLKYWLKSFTRDQFKLKGRTVELCNLGMLYVLLSIMQHMCVERDAMVMMTYYCPRDDGDDIFSSLKETRKIYMLYKTLIKKKH